MHATTSAPFAQGAAKFESLADTRILLNVHRGDDPYFEWARVIEAVANGCVVATETLGRLSSRSSPGEHLLMAPLEYLAEQAVALAFDEPRRAADGRAAHELLRHGAATRRTLLDAALRRGASGSRGTAAAVPSAAALGGARAPRGRSLPVVARIAAPRGRSTAERQLLRTTAART